MGMYDNFLTNQLETSFFNSKGDKDLIEPEVEKLVLTHGVQAAFHSLVDLAGFFRLQADYNCGPLLESLIQRGADPNQPSSIPPFTKGNFYAKKYSAMIPCDKTILQHCWQILWILYQLGGRPSPGALAELAKRNHHRSDFYEGLYVRYMKAICGIPMDLSVGQINGMSGNREMQLKTIDCLDDPSALDICLKKCKISTQNPSFARAEIASKFVGKLIAEELMK